MTTTTTTGSPLQQFLETLASTRPDSPRASPTETPTYASVINAGHRTPGWDPREVWLDRIKKPRDERRAASLELEVARVAEGPIKGSR